MDELPVILLVEDEEALHDFLKDALTDAGFDLTVSVAADEALVLLTSGVVNYRALVTDVNLKGPMSGWDLARQVREIAPAFPVVYICGDAADQWGSQGVPNSILVQKPFAPAQLVTAISQLLNVGSAGLSL
ncbi:MULTISPECIES: response regulator [unclassified Bradyrhizobium]|uniref:response regulator n=1 Tax=unclassified Bradyrhizobium TaxID=2631580 RepID=UPI0028E77C27|nr:MULTISPECIES: response regulator [unclassified Bradyrhizobium]